MMEFDLEYEVLIKNLKYDFLNWQQWALYCSISHAHDLPSQARLGALRENFRRHLFELQQFIQTNFVWFDARRVSSLLGVPTQPMSSSERLLHRIWMGSHPPAIVREAMRQWQRALDATDARDEGDYASLLWVWDQKQLRDCAGFIAAPNGNGYRIGSFVNDGRRHAVHSLRAMAIDLFPHNFDLFKTLHAQGYFVNLADFFRLAILQQHGGIYLDADTIPYRSATIFLAKPEVPDYLHGSVDAATGEVRQCLVSWMNLIDDENGVLIARKGNPAIAQMVQHIDNNLCTLSRQVPDKSLLPEAAHVYAAALHRVTYDVWRHDLGRTLLSYDQLEKSFSVLHEGKREPMINGVRGMRLLVDALTNQTLPLAVDEQRSYDHCVGALDRLDWRLDNLLDLPAVAELTQVEEVPRMAYAPQLRAEPEGCNYYSFLSQDSNLDRVNALFAGYLTALNGQRIDDGNFWCKIRGRGRQENYHSRIANYAGVHYTLHPGLAAQPVLLC